MVPGYREKKEERGRGLGGGWGQGNLDKRKRSEYGFTGVDVLRKGTSSGHIEQKSV